MRALTTQKCRGRERREAQEVAQRVSAELSRKNTPAMDLVRFTNGGARGETKRSTNKRVKMTPKSCCVPVVLLLSNVYTGTFLKKKALGNEINGQAD